MKSCSLSRKRPAALLSLGLLLASPVFAAFAATAPAEAPAPTVQVDRFAVSGNTLLDPALIATTLEPFKGRRSLDELRRAADAVQRLYADAGYGGVVAYLPPQTGTDGSVALRVMEGKLAAITVTGAQHFSEAQVRASVPDLVTGSTPRLRRIDAQIAIANENPAKRTQVLLKPGAQPGEIGAELTLHDRSPQSIGLTLDDTGNARTGRYRAGLSWQHANLSGNDDVLTAQYMTSPSKADQVTVLSAAYRMPLPTKLMVLDAYIAYSDVDGGSATTAAGDVRITGRGHLAGVRATWHLPRLGDVEQRVGLALDRREYQNRCDIAGLPAGACGNAGDDVAVTPLSLDYALRGAEPIAWSGTLTLLANLPIGERGKSDARFAAQRYGAQPEFGILRLSTSAQGEPLEGWQLRGRFALQWTSNALISGEQFGLGGAYSVRGFEEREIAGDRGASASVELLGPDLLARAAAEQMLLRPLFFIDGGVASNTHGVFCAADRSRCSLAGAGLGLAFERQRLQARLVAASALKEGTLTQRGDWRAHFSAALSF